MSDSSYFVASGHVETLRDGRMVGPGEGAPNVNPDDPHESALIDSGALVRRVPKPTGESGGSQSTGGQSGEKSTGKPAGENPAAEPQKEDRK